MICEAGVLNLNLLARDRKLVQSLTLIHVQQGSSVLVRALNTCTPYSASYSYSDEKHRGRTLSEEDIIDDTSNKIQYLM